MRYLADTNIFLEILLGQQESEKCKAFLHKNKDSVGISDFSLDSVGVILFKVKAFRAFDRFYADIFDRMQYLALSKPGYQKIGLVSEKYHLDFDDAYQVCIAMENGL